MFRIGISGWRYAGWRGAFYPPGLPQRRELAYVAERLNSVEINGSFYSLQRPSSYQRWRDETPDDFVFAVKGGRYLTHLRRLAGVETALANFFASGVLVLGPKLGPVLWQLPPTFAFEPVRLATFLAQLPRTTGDAAALAAGHDDKLSPDRAFLQVVGNPGQPIRHAFEVRHDSFRDPAYAALLRDHQVASVAADTAGRFVRLDEVTADFAYVRLHGDAELYVSGYGDAALDVWAERMRGWAADGLDVYAYFDNDAHVHAPYDAMALARRLGVA